MPRSLYILKLCLGGLLISSLGGCNQGEETASETPAQPPVTPSQNSAPLEVEPLLQWIQQRTSSQLAQQLQRDVSMLLDEPSEQRLQAARASWQQTYLAFLSARVLGYVSIQEPPEWHRNHSSGAQTYALIDSWPVTGGYIDHVPGYPLSGVVNDRTLAITAPVLLEQQGFSSEDDISVGFHAVRFMLFGEDQPRDWRDFIHSDASSTAPAAATKTSNPVENSASQTTVRHHQRRRDYLACITQLLLTHIERLQHRWNHEGHYQSVITNSDHARLTTVLHEALVRLVKVEILKRRLDQPQWSEITGRQPHAELAALFSSAVTLIEQLGQPQSAGSPLAQWLATHASRSDNQPEQALAWQTERQQAESLLQALQQTLD